MLIYVIDAFNLIYATPELADSTAPRADLLRFMKEMRLTGSSTNRAIVVFDGYPAEGVDAERLYEVHFSKSRTADDLIRDLLTSASHPRQIVVVSDDRAVRDAARSVGARPMPTEEFLHAQRKHAKPGHSGGGDEKLIEGVDELNEELEKIWSGTATRDS